MIRSDSGKLDTIALNIYEAIFEPCMEGVVIPPQLVAAGGTLIKPDEPERAGYTWKGWYTERIGGSRWDFETDIVSEDTTLYGHWDDETPPDAPLL